MIKQYAFRIHFPLGLLKMTSAESSYPIEKLLKNSMQLPTQEEHV